MTILSKIVSFAFGDSPSFWMRDVDGRMARIVSIPGKGKVRYSLDQSGEEHDCSVADWQALPIWTGRIRTPDVSRPEARSH